jgi:hypothetical protein
MSPRAKSVVAAAAVLAGAAVGVPAWAGLSSSGRDDRGGGPATASSLAAHCPTAAAAARADRGLRIGRERFQIEASGWIMHLDLLHVARNPVLLGDLAAGDLAGAQAEAERQLVHHVVRIRVIQGARVVLDANPTSFDVAGSAVELRGPHRRPLGRLEITIQDVIGYAKLERRHDATYVVARGAHGEVRTLLAAARHALLPASGCARVGAQTYVVRSFHTHTFTGEPLAIYLLTAP